MAAVRIVTGRVLVFVSACQVLFIVRCGYVALVIVVIGHISVESQLFIVLLGKVQCNVLLYVVFIAGSHIEITGIGNDGEVVSVILEVVTLQVEVLFVVIAISGLSR